MILHLHKEVKESEATQMAIQIKALCFHNGSQYVLVNSSKEKMLPPKFEGLVEQIFTMENDMQLSSRAYQSNTRKIHIEETEFGGTTRNTILITGPCSIESRSQIRQSAKLLKSQGLTTLRAGCFKPRTSPYSFQGLGLEGLKMLDEIRTEFGLHIITEVRDASHVEEVIHYADIIQIGAKAMYDQGVLRACGAQQKPVLLKRGFGSTLQEFVQAAEFVLSGGNPNVMLCERGIRTFETKTRFTLDLCGVAFLKKETNLPIILDPSHAMGYRYGVPDLTRACMAMGVDGLLIESHPNPKEALSDADQQIDFDTFRALHSSLFPIAKALGRTLI